ncbi:NAD(P)-dependent oxidoreductase [Leucothrix arctica]|uniref:6-phosphogluconate dehydrogenase n=1 Tax=Leucothrix arctica TaxID=1481894 RepID=A0A317C5V0_9GAMM|nr:NAD(P)-dependent oxidoreductase [Leucothrix arctica]PWQ93974.1 6-phosphogluconate dehydrogenase [Leucothrix arctica]
MTNKVALIGAGVMGGAIGTRLLETGNSLAVSDPSEEKVAVLTALGATAATSAADAAADADFVILSLNASKVVEHVVFGENGVSSTAKNGTMIIDMSSIDPVSTQSFAAKAKEAGLRWLDCPLSGGAPKAVLGTLAVMVGGDETDFEDSKAVMNHLCSNYTLMGPSGAGQTTKLINQVLCALNFVAIAEATRLAQDAGVDASKIPEALAGGRADSAILQEYMAKMAANDYSPTGRIDNMVKDLNGVQDLARATQTSMPLTAVCAEIHRVFMTAGLGGLDNAALMKFYEGPSKGDLS